MVQWVVGSILHGENSLSYFWYSCRVSPVTDRLSPIISWVSPAIGTDSPTTYGLVLITGMVSPICFRSLLNSLLF